MPIIPVPHILAEPSILRESCLKIENQIKTKLAQKQLNHLAAFSMDPPTLNFRLMRARVRQRLLDLLPEASVLDMDETGAPLIPLPIGVAFSHTLDCSFIYIQNGCSKPVSMDAENMNNPGFWLDPGWYVKFKANPCQNRADMLKQWTIFEAAIKFFGISQFMPLGKKIFINPINDDSGRIVHKGRAYYWKFNFFGDYGICCGGGDSFIMDCQPQMADSREFC